ncbi:IS3 family transposase [Streptomyces sp. NPDC006739]|uniref:IS3 family transposase n=1 Tax=Streptomyces sp. NPDC006739 TaxID=3364763 RepID=UPI003679F919
MTGGSARPVTPLDPPRRAGPPSSRAAPARTDCPRSGRHECGQRGLRELPRSLKRETLQGAHDYGDAATCRRTVFAWLTRYNTRRRHSANGHLSPNEYEHRHHTAKLTLAA